MKFVIVALLVACVAAEVAVHEEPELLGGWQEDLSFQVTDETVTIRFEAKEQNMDRIKEIALAVSDPTNPSYGEYLSQADIDEITAPSASDVESITSWLSASGVTYRVERGRSVIAKLAVSEAESLFSTTFRQVVNYATDQVALRASVAMVPESVASACDAIFGFHGLPLPPRKAVKASTPAIVTPDVITAQYKVSGVTVTRSTTNRQAVAEFQGQTMKDSDLSTFFTKYVKNSQNGDEKVYKFVGDPGEGNGGVEASLDIQYIMGVAPGIKTEFWYQKAQAFCTDLKAWTTLILGDAGGPNVHSVSYGWQGELSQLGCTDPQVAAVEADFAKIATKGVSIIFASGDSGSGNAAGANCQSSSANTALEGTVERTFAANNPQTCCIEGRGAPYTFAPVSGPKPPVPPSDCSGTTPGKADTGLVGTVQQTIRVPNAPECCRIGGEIGVAWTFTPPESGTEGTCTIYSAVTGTKTVHGAYSAANPHPHGGNCTLFSKVTGNKTETGAYSGGVSTKIILFPSWPASSPWITAVGSTRFIDQKPGNAEMSTDQFGSGGGFSSRYDQTDAQWQSKVVADYVKNAPADPHLPPAGSFPATGRATPDVSALGEGYQVYVDGRVESVGGTSASTPCFAGLVSMLNEARAAQSKKALGFLNQFIYQNAAAFTDVTVGTNAIGRGGQALQYGWNCTTGWDPSSGFGTPKFDKLLAAALAAP